MAGVIFWGIITTLSLAIDYSFETNCVCNVSCENSGLTEIPQCLPHSIREILISRNNITQINGSSLNKYDSLQSIDISDNRLSTLETGSFENTSKLTNIKLRRNFIKSLPSDLLKSLSKLEMFSVSANSIEEIPETMFDHNVNLKSLYLYENKLRRVGKNLFRNLKKLQRLNFSNNLITSIHVDTFSGNPSLKELFMKFNRIGHLDSKLFERNGKLEYLDLSGNDLMSLEAGIFKPNRKLTTVVMSDNPWHCDCHMKTTLLELKDINIELDNIGKCWTPEDIGELSSLLKIDRSCQTNETTPQLKDEQNSERSQVCDDTYTKFYLAIVGGFVIILLQVMICSCFAIYRYVALKKADDGETNVMKLKSAPFGNHYTSSSSEKPINITNKRTSDQNEYNYIVPMNNESLYACISENDPKYMSMTVYDKISPPREREEDIYTVMKPQNVNVDAKYLTMKGKFNKYDNVR